MPVYYTLSSILCAWLGSNETARCRVSECWSGLRWRFISIISIISVNSNLVVRQDCIGCDSRCGWLVMHVGSRGNRATKGLHESAGGALYKARDPEAASLHSQTKSDLFGNTPPLHEATAFQVLDRGAQTDSGGHPLEPTRGWVQPGTRPPLNRHERGSLEGSRATGGGRRRAASIIFGRAVVADFSSKAQPRIRALGLPRPANCSL